jgi:DNA-binding GntR family transcriptional regulator
VLRGVDGWHITCQALWADAARRSRLTSDQLISASGYALKHIRAMIHDGRFDADGRLPIASLSEMLGVSRTPVRDALWELAREGLVTVSPRIGAFVRWVTPAEARDIYRIKAAIEPLVTGWATERGGPAERTAYLYNVERLPELAEDGDVRAYIEHLERCRTVLMSLAASPPAVDALSVIDGRVRLLRFRNLSQEGQLRVSAVEHLEIATAVATGDVAAAVASMASHTNRALDRVLRLAELHVADGQYWLATADPRNDQ